MTNGTSAMPQVVWTSKNDPKLIISKFEDLLGIILKLKFVTFGWQKPFSIIFNKKYLRVIAKIIDSSIPCASFLKMYVALIHDYASSHPVYTFIL